MAYYDHFWDMMSVERTLHSSVIREREKGKAEGLAEGIQQGQAEGERNKAIASAKTMKADGMPASLIAKYTGLSEKEISNL